MSHVSKIELEVKSLEVLKKACQQMGFQFMTNQKTYQWFGRWMNDTPLPEGVKVEDIGKCDHAIKVPGCHYEIGVVRLKDGYTLLWDYWHSGGLEQHIGPKAGKLKQAYATERIRQEAKLKGYRVSEKKMRKGVRLVLTV